MHKQEIPTHNTIRGTSAPRMALRPWLQLMVGIVTVFVFIFGIGTLATYLPGARHMAQVIEERDLRATAIFYTDFKESAEGSEYIRDCIEYPPMRMPLAQ